MKKILFLMPLMAISFLANCGKGDPKTYTLSTDTEGVTFDLATITEGEDYVGKIIVTADGKKLPDNLDYVTLDDEAKTPISDYTYKLLDDKKTADFKIPANNIKGNIRVGITLVPINYSIEMSAFGCSVEGLEDEYNFNDEAILKFTANEEGTLPNDLKVKMGEKILTKDTDYEYVLDNTFTYADFKVKITDNVRITISAIYAEDALTFTCNSDNASFGIYHFVTGTSSNITTDLEYIVKNEDGEIREQKELKLTDDNVGAQLLCDKKLNQGDTIELYGNNPTGFNKLDIEITEKGIEFKKIVDTSFYTGENDDFSVSGNIMSLVDKTNFTTLKSVPGTGCFNFLFASDQDKQTLINGINDEEEKYYCNITDASDLYIPCTGFLSYYSLFAHSKTLEIAPVTLPALDLSPFCYGAMFLNCAKLKKAPELPAKTLSYACYLGMFMESSLIDAPELKATTLAGLCYAAMFTDCTSLKNPPSTIKADELKNGCCSSMFHHCTSLISTPNLPTTKLAPSCYYQMFYECTSLKTTYDLPATKLEDYCYSGMYLGCEALVKAPDINAETLAEGCCSFMFRYCKVLTTVPLLKAKKLVGSCYFKMFADCESLLIKKQSSGAESFCFFECPSGESYCEDALAFMFNNTPGDFISEGQDPKPGDKCFCCYK
ncbi:MAG: hypothetical protein MJ208_03875 [Bacilli bacterium]|nr:hypothetical protein [Bacilli bacterium]